MAEGRGLSVITVSGLRGLRLFPLRSNRARRAFYFFYARSGGGSRLFLCRVGRGIAPLDLPVLIPRVKKRPSPRDPRGVVRETTPSNANKRRCTPTSVPFGSPSARGYARGGCVCAPCRPSAAVSVVRGESRRRSRRKKSAAVSVLTSSPETLPRFSCPRQVS